MAAISSAVVQEKLTSRIGCPLSPRNQVSGARVSLGNECHHSCSTASLCRVRSLAFSDVVVYLLYYFSIPQLDNTVHLNSHSLAHPALTSPISSFRLSHSILPQVVENGPSIPMHQEELATSRRVGYLQQAALSIKIFSNVSEIKSRGGVYVSLSQRPGAYAYLYRTPVTW